MKTKIKPFIGRWFIVEMEAWDQEYLNMEVPGHFTFTKDGTYARGDVVDYVELLLHQYDGGHP